MKTLWIVALMLVLSLKGFGQDIQEGKQKGTWTDKKAERKAIKNANKITRDSLEMIDYQKALLAIKEKQMVLETYMVFDKYGNSETVSEMTNFVVIIDEEATLQLVFPYMPDANGVGGITLEGKTTGFEVKQDKKGTTYVRINVMGSSLNAEINITLPAKTNKATAYISANTLPYKVRYDGYLKHASESIVFKGRSL